MNINSRHTVSSKMKSVTGKSKNLSFSGHETFHCRSLWLKKGYDLVSSGHEFAEPEIVVELGVGKNMARSIEYWIRAFGIKEEDRLSKVLIGSRGKDPYLENMATLWLLHHRLITNQVASIYSLVFNEFRREKTEFTRDQLLMFIRRKCEQSGVPFNRETVERDIGVFLKTYLSQGGSRSNLEDDVLGLFVDLELVEELETADDIRVKRYRIVSSDRPSLPAEIVLSCILMNESYGDSVSFYELLNGFNSVGSIFALSADGLMSKIELLTGKLRSLTYKEDAGVRLVQFKSKSDPWQLIKEFYES